MTDTPLTAKELAARLGIGYATYFTYQKRGAFKPLLLSRPIGRRKYSAALVADFLAGGHMARLMRRAS